MWPQPLHTTSWSPCSGGCSRDRFINMLYNNINRMQNDMAQVGRCFWEASRCLHIQSLIFNGFSSSEPPAADQLSRHSLASCGEVSPMNMDACDLHPWHLDWLLLGCFRAHLSDKESLFAQINRDYSHRGQWAEILAHRGSYCASERKKLDL